MSIELSLLLSNFLTTGEERTFLLAEVLRKRKREIWLVLMKKLNEKRETLDISISNFF